ncbi:MAG TPA: nitroreductase family protein [Baekduia sp.]|jgi:SagB-type dehydrogenase family enzyme
MSDPRDELRPLVAGTVRSEEGAVVVELGTAEARVAGDVALVQAVLGACDGQSSVAEIAAVHGEAARELIALLVAEGAVVPAEHAWRVLHRQSSVGSALGRPIGDAELAELTRGAFAPATAARRVLVPPPAPSGIARLAGRRRSTVPADPPRPATLADLVAILTAAYGVPPGDGAPRSGTVPSAGALYPLALHVLLREPAGEAEPGLWWSDPASGALHRVGEAPDDVLDLFVAEPALAVLLAADGPIVFVSADLARPSRKYGARGYRYALLEAGAAMQNAHLAATERDLPLRAIGGIADGAVHRLLDLPDTGVALLALLVGR